MTTLSFQCARHMIENVTAQQFLFESDNIRSRQPLQGLNFQLAAVLLSIGVYAYIESGM